MASSVLDFNEILLSLLSSGPSPTILNFINGLFKSDIDSIILSIFLCVTSLDKVVIFI